MTSGAHCPPTLFQEHGHVCHNGNGPWSYHSHIIFCKNAATSSHDVQFPSPSGLPFRTPILRSPSVSCRTLPRRTSLSRFEAPVIVRGGQSSHITSRVTLNLTPETRCSGALFLGVARVKEGWCGGGSCSCFSEKVP